MSLESLLKARIKQSGPITLAEYMEAALTHPEFGYYMRRDPLGADGDFTTAPEISQIFGELIGAWLAAQWEAQGRPQAVLAELGPGRGTLMADILRATKSIPGFHDAIDIMLIETSPALKMKQWELLAGKHPRITWEEKLENLPAKPLLLIANEFFDALPVRQFVAGNERMVDASENGEFFFSVIPAKAGIQANDIDPGLRRGDEIVEVCETAINIASIIAQHISAHGGAALIVDYGYAGGKHGNTLQAVKNHRYHDPLSEPGSADLTCHVDFDALARAAQNASVYGAVPQGTFLGRLGAKARAAKLCEHASAEQSAAILSGIERLTSPDAMGDLFKVLCILPPKHPTPEGF